MPKTSYPKQQKVCPTCALSFEVGYKERYRKCCSTNCARTNPGTRAAISLKLSGRPSPKRKVVEPRACLTCGKTLTKRNGVHCDNACAHLNPTVRDKQSKVRTQAILDGKGNTSSIRCTFRFQGATIRCDSKLEYACLDYFVRHHEVHSIERCPFSIPYTFEGRPRRYIPDFIIHTGQGSFIVEGKDVSRMNSLNEKWGRYNEMAPLKQTALREYADQNGLTPFWFSQTSPGSRYRQISSEELKSQTPILG